jgi:hypothetical protein
MSAGMKFFHSGIIRQNVPVRNRPYFLTGNIIQTGKSAGIELFLSGNTEQRWRHPSGIATLQTTPLHQHPMTRPALQSSTYLLFYCFTFTPAPTTTCYATLFAENRKEGK